MYTYKCKNNAYEDVYQGEGKKLAEKKRTIINEFN